MKKAQKIMVLILKLCLSSAIIIFIFSKFDIAKSIYAIKSFNILLFIPIFFIEIITYLFRAIKLYYLLKINKLEISFIKIYKLMFIGAFLNNFIPGGMGDVAKGYYNAKWVQGSKTRIYGINLFDKIIAVSSIFFIAMFSLVYYKNLLYGLLGLFSLIPFLLFVLLPLFSKINIINKLINYIEKKFRIDLKLFYSIRKYNMNDYIITIIFSILGWVTTYISLFIIFKYYIPDTGFLDIILKSPILILVKLLPISFGGLGVDEAAISYSFIQLSSNNSLILASALIYRIIILAAVLLGGIFVGYEHMQKSKQNDTNI